MSESAPAAKSPDPFRERTRARPLLIAVPLYRRPDLARRVIRSLIACAAEVSALQGEVVLYDDSPDDPSLAEALDGLMPAAQAALRCRRETNPTNIGFVRTANRALAEAVERGFDAVLLNSDAVVTPGALSEMARVALQDPMIGFVNPRSNNATLATLPFQDRFRRLPPAPARRAWEAVAARLPPFSYVPTANGFCVLIRWTVLAEFGGFDEIYGRGYNEENDLAMRAGRRGYRAVLANHAFVWHEGSGSFESTGQGGELETRNRATLLARYPEYPGLTEHYFRSPEQRAELLLGALIPDADGRLDVALDFSSFVAAHNGTFEAGAQLLAGAAQAWRERFNLFVLCSPDVYDFHGFARFGVDRREPYGPEMFAAVFRVGQPYETGALDRLALKAAAFGVFMLDTISLDCSQLADPELHQLWGWSCEHADLIAATSALTDEQLTRRLPFGRDVLRVRSLHSLDLADYRLPVGAPGEDLPEAGYVFVVGNHYAHKDVAAAVAMLAADPVRRVVVLASNDAVAPPADDGLHAPRGLGRAPNVVRVPPGRLSSERMGALYAGAAAVVFPSHYEGFGIPLMNALAARRPVVVRALPVFEELRDALGGEANIHVFATLRDLAAVLEPMPAWDSEGASEGRPGDGLRAARDIGDALEAAIAGADYARIVRRIRHRPWLTRASVAPPTPRAFVADAVGRAATRAAAAVLALPGVFVALRLLVRMLRRLRRPSGG